MTQLIIGHRGVGKTSLLRRLESYHRSRQMLFLGQDLDREIEVKTGKSVEQIFATEGEDHFRKLERETLHSLVEQHRAFEGSHFIVVGAGYQGELPNLCKVLWLRRPSDRLGRIFVDRPRLDSAVSPIDEYMARYLPRVARYRRWHHKQITLEEGWDFENEIEPILVGLKPTDLGMSITVLPEVFADELRLEDFIADKIQLGVRYFELRDDLLSKHQIERLFREIPHDRLLFSFRNKNSIPDTNDSWWFKCQYDWALELGECPWGVPKILSLHFRDRHEGVREVIDRLMQQKAEHYKLAIPIESLMELWVGHQWQAEDPGNRSFQPMSLDGRWWWYRALRGRDMKVNFFSDGEGSSFDQPSLFQQLMVNHSGHRESFAAILGDPVQHSRTPAEQHEFFRRFSMPTVAIDLHEDDFNQLGLGVLHRLGLRAAAVTSPFKEAAAGLCEGLLGPAKDLKSVNTIIWSSDQQGWLGSNTDILGLEKVLAQLELPKSVFVWGGGGVRSTLMRLLPKAHFFRARSGEEIFGAKVEGSPSLLVWCVGRSRQANCDWPPQHWKPLMVLDLNYAEDSPGREYALKTGAKYFSGLEMFRAQAEFQRQFWSAYLPKDRPAEAQQ